MRTAPSLSDRKISILIIIAALCIHGGIGSLFFILEPTFHPLDAKKTEIILFNEQKLNEPPTSTALVSTPQEEWGEMLARKNNFGLPDGKISIDRTEKSSKTNESQSSPTTDKQPNPEELSTTQPLATNDPENKIIQTAAISTQQQEPLSKNLKSPPASLKKDTSLPADNTQLIQDTVQQETNKSEELPQKQSPLTPQDTNTATRTTPAKKYPHSTPSKQIPPELTLAAIGRGFIEQSKHDSTHNVTMLGKKGGALSAEQLKIERYVERLSWSLQNSFKLLRNTIDTQLPPECDAQVYLQLNRSGSIKTLELLKSSGNTLLDNHTLAVFKNAGTSFPPVPTYIEASPFVISFHIDYGINKRPAPFSFSLQH